MNQLARETSPYLLQHKDNPVDWMPWGDEALALAARQDRPILLSVGYAACHWCHVMAHESFENPEIAALMNELFINIKVDREERPDLDVVYQSALALMGQHGGWPLTMFLTPKGEPFWGGTYFPPEERWGRPGFATVLSGVAETYRQAKDKVRHNAATLCDALAALGRPQKADGTLRPDTIDATALAALSLFDPENGGVGGAPKFPQPSLYSFLWRAWRRGRDPRVRDMVTTTLSRMCQGGIFDHLGGGFCRYATDSRWLVPHFEKMLYDNALLLSLMSAVWRETKAPLLEVRIRETVAWVLNEMRTEDGAFASSLDADSEGGEGRFYVWSAAEIDRILGEDAAAFRAAYGVSAGGNWEGVNILNLSDGPVDATHPQLESARKILLRERNKRVRPRCDDKVLADWNGLMIEGLADAAMALGEKRWLEAAGEAFTMVATRMSEQGRLFHSWRMGRARHMAVLDDYADMASAALALFKAGGDENHLEQARAWVRVADRHYWDEEQGGYFLTADDADNLIARTKPVADNATPSANGTMVGVLARLYALTGDESYRTKAEAVLSRFSGDAPGHMLNLPSLLSGYALLIAPVVVVVVGTADDPATDALVKAVLGAGDGDALLVRVEPGRTPTAGHSLALTAAGKGMVEGRATAYVCGASTCGPPLDDGAELSLALKS